jgi:hypothetical protein
MKMNTKTLFLRAALSFTLTGAVSLALGAESDPCPVEKGPCCDLDWTGQGATVVKINGEGLVSRAQDPYVRATVGMRVENGGRVFALENSTVIVAFDDGCWHAVEENEMVTIEDVSPCCALLAPVAAPPPAVPATAAAAGIPPVPLIAAVPAVLAGVCAATDCLNDSDGSTGTSQAVQLAPVSQ